MDSRIVEVKTKTKLDKKIYLSWITKHGHNPIETRNETTEIKESRPKWKYFISGFRFIDLVDPIRTQLCMNKNAVHFIRPPGWNITKRGYINK